jgi:predicted methyltransferase
MRGGIRAGVAVLLGLFAIGCEAPAAAPRTQAAPAPQGGLFRPEALGLLEDPDREEWQQPDRVMDELRIADGSRVADVGAGGGWFTTRLARRVGPNGAVYAEDVQPQMIESIRQRARQEGLTNVTPILSATNDPQLPPNLDAVLLVDAYGQLAHPIDVLRHIRGSLAANGRLGIVDFKPGGAGGPGPPPEYRVDPERIRRDAASVGLVLRNETSLQYQYVLILGR